MDVNKVCHLLLNSHIYGTTTKDFKTTCYLFDRFQRHNITHIAEATRIEYFCSGTQDMRKIFSELQTGNWREKVEELGV